MLGLHRSLWVIVFGISCALTVFGMRVVHAQDQGPVSPKTEDEQAVQYPDTVENEEVPGNNAIEARPVSPARKEALKRRPGEKVRGEPRGRSVVLGMHIQEADNERAKVVEVAPASAAFDAGIRKGDEIISFDGFKATKYREWIDGMQRLATDAPDGETLPIVLVRGDKKLNLRIRMPVARAGALPPEEEMALQQTVIASQPGQPGLPVGQPQPFPPGGGDDVLIANAFGNEFGNQEGGPTEQAIAEIHRLAQTDQPSGPNNELERPTDATADQSNATTEPTDSAQAPNARVGLAGFRDDANGLFVMIDVSGLPPGNYLVGIDDPGVLISSEGNVNAPQQPTPQQKQPAAGAVGRPATGVQQGTKSPEVPRGDGGTTPAARPTSLPAGSPQSGLKTAIPRAVLAQVTETDAPGSAAIDTPPTGTNQPLDTPPTGQVRESSATATGLSRAGDPRDNPNFVNKPGFESGSELAGASVGPALHIGTLTVDQNGVGRLQQVVESVRVQDVVGLAIGIYSQNGAPQAAQGGEQPPSADGLDRGSNAASRTAPTSDAEGSASDATNNGSGSRAIAAGLIRPMSGGAPSGSTPADGQALPSPAVPGAQGATPQATGAAVPTNPVR